ncbi:MAG TPA: GntG family PLP-dependent aldolase [Fimbriimonadaceae bacterium]
MPNPFPASQQDVVDLRSDTVTRPNAEMYEAMMNAKLGDDVLGDDPTVNELEELAAKKTGKEAAMFVPSGTMGNQIAVATHTNPGDAILIEEDAHILYYEVGAPAVISNVVSWTLPSNKGVMDPEVVERHVLKRTLHTPGTVLLCLENTHNRAGGTIIPLAKMAEYRAICDHHGVKLHLDGARVFNAAVGLGVPVNEITKHVDTVSICLSKGLGSPIGSLLCGPADFIEDARMWRKRLGGGMRQAGILAACGIVSLTKMVDRLAEDHKHARAMASALNEIPGLTVDWDTVQTNMVVVGLSDSSSDWVSRLAEMGVWVLALSPRKLRLVFHADVDDAKLDKAINAFKTVASAIA